MPIPQPKPLRQVSAVSEKKYRRRVGNLSAQQAGHGSFVSAPVLLSIIGLATLGFRRSDYDSPLVMLVEAICCIALIWLSAWLHRKSVAKKSSTACTRIEAAASAKSPVVLAAAVVIAIPWLVDLMARRAGFGNGMEIVMLSYLAWGSLAGAWISQSSRPINLSVICSGFLTLFTTFISDSSLATWFAYAWLTVCLWWLIANHWERMERTAAADIQVVGGWRWTYLVMGCCLFLGTTSLFSDRIPVLRKLKAEIMPTSGGTSGRDSAARSGVGNGDALIAAKQHAASFGAVETDLFLDSEKPSLFDVFNDEFGEPKLNKRVERAQALSRQETRLDEGKFAETNRSSSGSEFSIDREKPKQHKPLSDLAGDALMFWNGEAGVRLAVQRFDRFEGVTWSQKPKAPSNQKKTAIKSIQIDDRTWFAPTNTRFYSPTGPYVDAVPEAIKFTRYRSPIIPTRAGTQMWSVDKLTEASFFSISPEECLLMPGREHIPDYTVVRFVNSHISSPRLDDLLKNCAPGYSHHQLQDACRSRVAELAHRFASFHERGWSQVDAVIRGIRREFKWERSSETVEYQETESLSTAQKPLQAFLETHHGPSYLFATAAALMLEHLGYETRLVTGFYVNPWNRLASDGEIAILPGDAHVWLEINAGHDHWVPLEPTPGFRPPRTTASWWYRLQQAKYAILITAAVLCLVAVFVYVLRARIFELVCTLYGPVIPLLRDRQQVAWLAWLMDMRLRFAGHPRQRGSVPRSHFDSIAQALSQDLTRHLQQYFIASDRLLFGSSPRLEMAERAAIRRLWQELTIAKIRSAMEQLKGDCK